MNVNRREVLAELGGLAATAALDGPRGRLSSQAGSWPLGENTERRSGFPRKADFLIDEGYTYINAAYIHPIPSPALGAARRATLSRGSLPSLHGATAHGENETLSSHTRALFAELINAKPSEIAYVPNTSTGENLVVQALQLDRKFHGNVVTDALHFEGALMNLLELEKKGLDVRIVRPTKEFRIDMKDLEKVVDKSTRLIEGNTPVTYTFSRSAAGMFEMGTLGSNNQITTALVGGSLGYIKELGVANIAAHRQPLLKKLREEVPRFGFVLVTPPESTSGSITFAKKDVGRSELPNRLQAARVNVRFDLHWMRLSPSVYNDMKDVDRFLEVLSHAQ